MTNDSLLLEGFKDPIKKSFASVFEEINLSAETWLNKTNLLTIGRENYANYIATRIGQFPLFGTNRVVNVSDVYTRVCISDDIESLRYKTRSEIEQRLVAQKRGHSSQLTNALMPLEALDNSIDGFALLGNPGSGKSTAFRHLAVEAARGTKIRAMRRLPVFLAVREMSKQSSTIAAEVARFFRNLDFEAPDRLLDSIASTGHLLLLLDGVDETTAAHRSALLEELLELRAKYPRACMCVSARPYSLSVGLQNFQKWETQPLAFEDRLIFVAKWFSGVDEEQGQRLVAACKNAPALLDLGSSPLLLSIVCALYHNDLEIPQEPDELYDRSIQGLLGQWDAFRNIARHTPLSGLSIIKRMTLVCEIAACLFNEGKIVFSVDDVTKTGALSRISAKFRIDELDATEVVASLANDFGLLLEKSPGDFSFSHLTIQEFLTAKYILVNRTDLNLVTEYRKNSRWAEVVKLVAKMLPTPEPFIDALHSVSKLGNRTHAETLRSIWALRPICDPAIFTRLMHGIATKIAASLKHCGETVIQIERDELNIYCTRHERLSSMRRRYIKEAITLAEQEADEGVTTTKSHALWKNPSGDSEEIVALTVPILLEILASSKLSLSTLGVKAVPFFSDWDSRNRPYIKSVSFHDLRELGSERNA